MNVSIGFCEKLRLSLNPLFNIDSLTDPGFPILQDLKFCRISNFANQLFLTLPFTFIQATERRR